MTIYFIRHGKTKANIDNKWQGQRSNLDLSNEGIEELNNLRRATRDINFDVVYSSPLLRAIKTANVLIENNPDAKLIVSNEIIERDFGELELNSVDENVKQLISDWDLNTDLDRNIEKIQDMYNKRIKPFLMNIKKQENNNNKHIAIVSHSWIGRMIAFFSSCERDKEVLKIAPKNAIVYAFEI